MQQLREKNINEHNHTSFSKEKQKIKERNHTSFSKDYHLQTTLIIRFSASHTFIFGNVSNNCLVSTAKMKCRRKISIHDLNSYYLKYPIASKFTVYQHTWFVHLWFQLIKLTRQLIRSYTATWLDYGTLLNTEVSESFSGYLMMESYETSEDALFSLISNVA